MAMLALALNVIGGLVMLVFGVKLLVAAFRTSIGWGVASLLIPFVLLVYVFKNWQATKSDFMGWLGGFVVMALGMVAGMVGAFSGAGQ